jgi:hypothetical protein
MVDHLETNPKVFFHPVLERIARIPAIHPDYLEARQFSDQGQEQLATPFTIAQISLPHFD